MNEARKLVLIGSTNYSNGNIKGISDDADLLDKIYKSNNTFKLCIFSFNGNFKKTFGNFCAARFRKYIRPCRRRSREADENFKPEFYVQWNVVTVINMIIQK